MKIPAPREIAFSSILWKESIASDSTLRTVDDYYSLLREHLKEQHVMNKDWLELRLR